MRGLRRIAAIAATGAVVGASSTWAQDVGVGEHEYRNNCAVCHGTAGKGDGPMAELIELAMPDLTLLSRNNGGVFPVERMYGVVDGREAVAAHGPRDMPVWGDEYNARAGSTGLLGYYVPIDDVDAFVKGRILALTDYISTLQVE